MKIKSKKFYKIKKNAEEFYKTIGQVYCPYLDAQVHFNREGFRHLLFKSWNRARNRQQQYTRLRLFSGSKNYL